MDITFNLTMKELKEIFNLSYDYGYSDGLKAHRDPSSMPYEFAKKAAIERLLKEVTKP